MAIKAVIFDFFGVISVRRHQAFIEQAIPSEKTREQIYELRSQHDKGLVSADDYVAAVAAAAHVSPEKAFAELHSERIINESLTTYIRTKLQPKYKIGLLSNAAGDLRTFVDPGLLDELFDDIVISAEVGMVKPDPHIFEYICKDLQVTPSQAIMVDDLKENCEGAETAGLRAVLYTSFPACQRQLDTFLQ